MKQRFYKINIDVFNSLTGWNRLDYLMETELLLNPLHHDWF